MSDNNLNKNTGIELNLGQTGTKKIIKQKGEQNNYFEMDYRQKYYDAKEDNFKLHDKIIKLEKEKFELAKKSEMYSVFLTINEIKNINDFLKKLTKKNIKFRKRLERISIDDIEFFNYFDVLGKDIDIFLDIAKEYNINLI